MEHFNPLDDGRGAGKDEHIVGPHSESDTEFIPKPEENDNDDDFVIDLSRPKAQNQFEKFLGFHDYQSGVFRELDFILKKQGVEALLQYIKNHPLPTFQEYLGDIEHTKPELHNRVLADIAINSHENNLIIKEFDTLISTINKTKNIEDKEIAKKEVEEAYKNLTDFFKKYSNSVRDNLN